MSASSCKSYIVTAQKATAVTASITGRFTGKNDLNLIIAKNNIIEFHLVCAEGLKPLKEVTIYGKICILKMFSVEGKEKDLLFIMTMKKDVMIIECHGSHDQLRIVTLASGNVQDRIGRLADNGPIGVIDPLGRMIGLRIYEGLIKVIPLKISATKVDPDAEAEPLKAFNFRLEEQDIIDLVFIEADMPTLAYIFQDNHGRHVKTVEINLEEKDSSVCPWKMDSIDVQASIIIPLPDPFAGIVIVGQEVITVRSKDGSQKTIAPPVIRTSPILTYEQLDNSRYLLGDMAGRLFMLFIDVDESASVDGKNIKIKDMKVELLGETSIPEAISYLDNGVVFIGSKFGDSQLIKLSIEADDTGSYIQVLETFTNLGPIVDMVIVDLDKQSPGQGQLVTCSGGFKDGSLRVIRNGVGINELGNIDLVGVKGVWALQTDDSGFDNILVITFIGQTRTLLLGSSMCNDTGDSELDVEEVTLPGFENHMQTYHCSTVLNKRIVQVTAASVRLICPIKGLLNEWKPSGGKTISVCAANKHQLVLASGRNISYVRIKSDSLTEEGTAVLPYEIACADITPLSDKEEESQLVAVGLWTDYSAHILTLPDLREVCVENLDVQIIPRSILMTSFDSVNYLFVAMGDGSLLYYQIETKEGGKLTERKKVCLGTQPMSLKLFSSLGQRSVFACSDHPTIIYSSNNKLIFANVNIREVFQMCPLNAQLYRNCVTLVTNSQLIFGTIDEIQKLHIRSIPLGETPRRIAYQSETGLFGVITYRIDLRQEGSYTPARSSVSLLCAHQSSVDGPTKPVQAGQGTIGSDMDEELEVNSLIMFDENTMEPVHAYHLSANPSSNEIGLSVISAKLGNDPNPYFILGTTYLKPGENEPESGRILVLQFSESGSLTKVAEKDIKGAPYAMCDFNGRLLVNVNSSVRLFEWNDVDKEFRLECSYFNTIMALYLKTKGDFALVGDLMRSMSLLLYKPVETTLDEIARDHAPNWMFAVEIIDDDYFLGAENFGNIFVCSREIDTSGADEKVLLNETGWFHTADNINVFRHGSLVMDHIGERTVPTRGSILFGTICGSIGMITQLPNPLYEFLNDLQNRLSRVIVGIGNIPHEKYRAFETDRKDEPPQDFVDGDLVESCLDLSRDQLVSIISGLKRKDDFSSVVSESVDCSVDDLIKIVEELSRLH